MAGSVDRIAPPEQLGFVVEDVEAAAREWGERCGVGPFFYFDTYDYEILYKGEQSVPRVTLAFSYSGDMQIELMQQHNDAPSVYRDFVRDKGTGLIHMGRFIADPKASAKALIDRGCVQTQFNWDDDAREDCIYLTTVSHPGGLVEFIRATPARARRAEIMKAIVRDWDGTDHFRSIASVMGS